MTESKAAKKVRAILEAAGVKNIPKHMTFRRTYAGMNQRAEGGWSWNCFDGSGEAYCGSADPLRRLTVGKVDVDYHYQLVQLHDASIGNAK